ncbi:MAG: dethiobiotin synthase [Psychrilyobacter sp.]|nr:dethiobiotin synthase [Psychrilyobacter sp.]
MKLKKSNLGELYFIVGTSTEVGKTFVTSNLIKDRIKNQEKVMVLKPIETGSDLFNSELEGSDSKIYADLLGKEVNEINSYFFTKAMSPHIAGKLDNIKISIESIKNKIDKENEKHEILYVEGAGGLFVPYSLDYTYLDLIKEYRGISKIIVVINNTLGAINHALLTLEVLKTNNIEIEGLIFNNRENVSNKLLLLNNIETIEKISGIKTLKVFEYIN